MLHFNLLLLFCMKFSVGQSVNIVTAQFIKVQKHIRAVESPDKAIFFVFAAIKRFLTASLEIARIGQPKRGCMTIEYKLYIRITYSLQEIFLFISITPLNFQSKEFFVNYLDFIIKNYRRIYEIRRIKLYIINSLFIYVTDLFHVYSVFIKNRKVWCSYCR